MLTLKIFLSSPGDVAEERRLAVETIRALEDSHLLRDRVNLKVVAWDDPAASVPMDARETPQASVNRWGGRPADCDLTIVVLWSRLGTPLPASLARADGTRVPSGTVWELEDAAAAGKPVFVYRRTDKPRIEIDDADFDQRRAQYDAVRRWADSLRDADGTLRAGLNEYATPAQFQQLLRQHLEAFIGRALAAAPATTGTPAQPPAQAPARPADPAPPHATPAGSGPRWLAPVAGLAALVVVAGGWAWWSRTGASAPPASSARDAAAATPATVPAQPPQSTSPSVSPAAAPTALPTVRLAGADALTFAKMRPSTYSVLALTPEAGTPTTWRLRMRVRLAAAPQSGGMNFWDSSFRLVIDGVPRAPDSNLNEIVDGGAAKDGDITFEVPWTAQALALRVVHYGESAELPLMLAGTRVPPAAAPVAGPVALRLAAAPEVVFTKPSRATFTVLQLATESRRPGVFGLRVRMRMAVPTGAPANFWDEQFRLLVDGVPLSPDSNLNLTVDGGAAQDGDVTFEVPDGAKTLVLRIQFGESARADLPLQRETPR